MSRGGRSIRQQRGRWLWWLAIAVPAAAWLLWASADPAPRAAPPPSVAATSLPSTSPMRATTADALARTSDGAAAARAEQRALWQQRLERAQTALDTYRHATRYPPTSQPLHERADQGHPNRWIEGDRRFGNEADADGLRLRTTQERVFVQGSESVGFTISLRDNADRILPLHVLRAGAREIPPPHRGSLYPEVPLAFNDDGTQGDAVQGDGVFGASLQPAVQGFAGLLGQIRVEAVLQHRDRQPTVHFDLVYTGDAPAVWGDGVRETMQDGSLHFDLKASVRQAGRYVVNARIDDANGTPVALLGFNEEVSAGPQEFRLTLAGKLVRDTKPAFPLTVRDVDGFLLHADAYPDRSLMPRRAGPVHVGADHALESFADTEWSSEQRSRYVDELGRDVAAAQARLERLER